VRVEQSRLAYVNINNMETLDGFHLTPRAAVPISKLGLVRWTGISSRLSITTAAPGAPTRGNQAQGSEDDKGDRKRWHGSRHQC